MAERALRIDLNADLGEGIVPGSSGLPEPPAQAGSALEHQMLASVTTTHLACGFHAGDPTGIRRSAEAAARAGVAVGAHPSYPDREGFGRRDLDRATGQVVDDVLYQLGALEALAAAAGTTVVSVKAHGALYHRLAVDRRCARALAEALVAHDPALWLVLPAGSAALEAARRAGARVVAEAFCDRAYRPDGGLVSRREPGALVTDPDEAAARAVMLAVDGRVPAVDGTTLDLRPATLCVHGDTPGAPAIAAAVRRGLAAAGVEVVSPAGPR